MHPALGGDSPWVKAANPAEPQVYPEGHKRKPKNIGNLPKNSKFLLIDCEYEFVAGMIHLGAVLPLGFLGRPKPQLTSLTSHPFHGIAKPTR